MIINPTASCSCGRLRLACRRSCAAGGRERLMDRRAKLNKVEAEAQRPLAGESLKDEGAKACVLQKAVLEAL